MEIHKKAIENIRAEIQTAHTNGLSIFAKDALMLSINMAEMLIEKNIAYGNSALEPVRIFSKAPAIEQIQVRLDDKLSRLARGSEYPGDDTIRDLIGYLYLYLMAEQGTGTVEQDHEI